MTEDELDQLLIRYVDGDATPQERLDVERLIAHDAAVGARLASHVEITRTLRDLRLDPTSDPRDVRETLDHIDQRTRRSIFVGPTRWVVRAASIAACVVVGGLIWRGMTGFEPTGPAAPLIVVQTPMPASSSDSAPTVSVGTPTQITPTFISSLFVAQRSAGLVEIRPAGRDGTGLD
jgi:anti-sigma factor RsiW